MVDEILLEQLIASEDHRYPYDLDRAFCMILQNWQKYEGILSKPILIPPQDNGNHYSVHLSFRRGNFNYSLSFDFDPISTHFFMVSERFNGNVATPRDLTAFELKTRAILYNAAYPPQKPDMGQR